MKYSVKFITPIQESWGNFNTKLSKITSSVIKMFANKCKKKFPQLSKYTDRQALINVFYNYKKKMN